MADSPQFLVLTPDRNVQVITNDGIAEHIFTDGEFRVARNMENISAVAGHTRLNSNLVEFIEQEELLPPDFIRLSIPQGPREHFGAVADLRYNTNGPLRAGVHLIWGAGGLSSFSYIFGGEPVKKCFSLGNLLHLEERSNGSDEAQVEVIIDPTAVDIKSNFSVSEWKPITTLFKDIHVTQGAGVTWSNILGRFRIRANLMGDGSSSPLLILEAIVLSDGTWNALPESKKIKISSSNSSAIVLTSVELNWFSPMPKYKLPTVAGIMRSSLEVPLPTEFEYRWVLQAVFVMTEGGEALSSKESYMAYWERPVHSFPSNQTVFVLNFPFYQAGPVPSVQGKKENRKLIWNLTRNGKCFVRAKPAERPSKYNVLPKKNFKLGQVLPKDSPANLSLLVDNLFNASIASSTSSSYSTAANHVSKLEKEIGREFSWPLSSQDSLMITTYLISKGIKYKSVKSYLNGVRRLAISKGVFSPAPQSQLQKAVLRGCENIQRDPLKEVANATHRPMSIPLLRIIGHHIATKWDKDLFERHAFWAACTVGFWGTLRIGELLCYYVSFSPKSDVLGSDVLNLSQDSMAIWLRDPKIPKPFGDVVEVWSTPQFSDIDPVASFHIYWQLRQENGFPIDHPLFLRSDGYPYTHDRFSGTLGQIISHYALELDLKMNRWTGHSFRSGLASLLDTAGFSEEQIKAWGRWTSKAFLLYTRDIAKRAEVKKKMFNVLDLIKRCAAGLV